MERWLRAFARYRSVEKACRTAHVGRNTVYTNRKTDEVFRGAWDRLDQAIDDDLEAAAVTLAIRGWLEPVYFQGVQCGTKRVFSPKLIEFLLRMRKSSRYNRPAGDSGTEGTTNDRARELREALAAMARTVEQGAVEAAPAPAQAEGEVS
jgi:hypothetical protein